MASCKVNCTGAKSDGPKATFSCSRRDEDLGAGPQSREVCSDQQIGQQKNEEPDQVTAIMQKIVDLKLPIAVWYTIDTPGFGEARALNNPDRTLRPNGEAFQTFIEKKFAK